MFFARTHFLYYNCLLNFNYSSMKNIFVLSAFLSLMASLNAQNPFRCDTAEAGIFKRNNVLVQKEYSTDKKTKAKTLNALREFDANGFMTKQVVPSESDKEIYHFNEWEFDANGNLLNHREGKIDKDSTQTISYSENYAYTSAGLLSRYRKEVFENENSTLSSNWEYEYNDKGEKKAITYLSLCVRKDSICNDEVKYSGSEIPQERTIHNYYPKGISDMMKYSASGLPVDYMRYEKGKAISHKIYSYNFDKQGVLSEEIIADVIAKTSEKMKYEKDKITYSKLNNKGKVLSTSSMAYSAPKVLVYPSISSVAASLPQKNDLKNISKKEKSDKKKNKVIENYLNGRLVSTDTYTPRGLIMESIAADGNSTVQYEYVFF